VQGLGVLAAEQAAQTALFAAQQFPYGGQPVGGKVRIKNAKRHYKLDVKAPQGSDGAISVYRGIKFAPFQITFFMWTATQYDYFVSHVLPILKFSGVKDAANPSQAQALTVYHPALANVDITSMLVEEIGAIEPKEDGPNMFECEVRCVEFLQPPLLNTTVTPNGATAASVTPSTVGVAPSNVIIKRNQMQVSLAANVAGG
jgi:hypothetical protein